jgi:hypothetical protein
MRAANHFDALDVFRSERGEVEGSAGFVQGDAVEQHFVVARLSSAHEQRREVAHSAGSDGDDSRHGGEEIDSVQGMAILDAIAVEDGHRHPHLRLWGLTPGCGDHDRLLHRRRKQHDGGRASRAERGDDGLEPGPGHLDAAGRALGRHGEASHVVCRGLHQGCAVLQHPDDDAGHRHAG